MAHDAFEIRTLGDGEKITEPGFYNIPLEQHHSQCCDGVSVTSGILRKLELETPADVWLTHKLTLTALRENRQMPCVSVGLWPPISSTDQKQQGIMFLFCRASVRKK